MIMNNDLQIKKMEEKLRNLMRFRFRRPYNIKILSEIKAEMAGEDCT